MSIPRVWRGIFWISMLGGLLLVAGCGEPQITPSEDTVRLMMRLNTAVMGEKPELLDGIQKDADALLQSGGISDAVHLRILEIMSQARGEKWKEAKDNCVSFLKGQRMKSG